MTCCQRCKSLLVRFIQRVGWVCSDCGHVEGVDEDWSLDR